VNTPAPGTSTTDFSAPPPKPASGEGRDRTKFIVISSAGETQPLFKGRAVLQTVRTLAGAAVACEDMVPVLPSKFFRAVEGHLEGEPLWRAFAQAHSQHEGQRRRWFHADPIHENGRTWLLSSQWGTQTEPTLKHLVELAPDDVSYRAASSEDVQKTAGGLQAPQPALEALAVVPKHIRELLGSLAADPMYQLSSGGRELFHSNMFYWLALMRPKESAPIWDLLGVDPPVTAESVPIIRREWRDIDLYVDSGSSSRKLVLENKVLAIPTAEQLADYERDISEQPLVEPDQTSWVLLSLMTPTFDPPAPWKLVSYDELLPRLHASAANLEAADANLIGAYANLVALLLQIRDTFDPVGATAENWSLPKPVRALLQESRALALVEKLRVSRAALRVQSQLKDQLAPEIPSVESGLSRTHGLLEWFVDLSDRRQVGWQFQESQFRLVVRLTPEDPQSHQDAQRLVEDLHLDFFDFSVPDHLTGLLTPYNGNKSWLWFGTGFIYRYQKVAPHASFDDFVDLCVWFSHRVWAYASRLRGT
jgi:hypothetical protein